MGKLTARLVASLATKGRYADGDGLYLFIDSQGRKYWQLRYMLAGRRRDMSIGPARSHTLADARAAASEARGQLARGVDPLDARSRSARTEVSFADAARRVHAARASGWRNGKHCEQWLTTLERHAFPTLGDIPLAAVTRGDVLGVLEPIWLAIPETARRVRQRIGAVVDWGVGAGIREHGVDMKLVGRALPRQPRRDGHFAALPYAEVPAFVAALPYSTAGPRVRAAIEMLILTASRPGNIRLMTWNEVDFDRAMWIVPVDKMKAGREHRIPLTPRVLSILDAMRDRDARADGLVFPSERQNLPLSLNAMRMAIRRMGFEVTAHGFRSSFKDWCRKHRVDEHLSEEALGHVETNEVVAAYARADLVDLRRPIMLAWAGFVGGAHSLANELYPQAA